MLTQINDVLGFLEKVKKINNYPEITSSDTITFLFGNFDYESRNPIHSKIYDERLFDSLSNHIRILLILNDSISLKNVHKQLGTRIIGSDFARFEKIYSQIQNYLGKNINLVTQCSFSLPGSVLETTTVRTLLNDFFTATIQHSKSDAQSRIDEINSLTYGALTEMIRIMVIDLKEKLDEYANALIDFNKNNNIKH